MKTPKPIPAEVVESFAAELASYRVDPRAGDWDSIRARLRKVAAGHGQSYTQLFDEVHRASDAVIGSA